MRIMHIASGLALWRGTRREGKRGRWGRCCCAWSWLAAGATSVRLDDGWQLNIRIPLPGTHPVASPFSERRPALDRLSGAVLRLAESRITATAVLIALLGVALRGAILPTADAITAFPGDTRARVGLESRTSADNALHWLDPSLSPPPLAVRAVLGLVGAVALLRLANRALPRGAPPAGRPAAAQVIILPRPMRWTDLARMVRVAGRRLRGCVSDGDRRLAVIEPTGVGPWLACGLYVGVLLLLGAGAVSAKLGWRSAPIALTLGETSEVRPGAGVQIRLDEIRYVPQDARRMRTFDTLLTVLEAGEPAEEMVLGLTRGSHRDGLAYYQVGFGPAVRLTVSDASGQPATVQHMPAGDAVLGTVRVRLGQPEVFIALPDADLMARLVLYEGQEEEPPHGRRLQVQVYRAGAPMPLLDQVLEAEARLELEGVVLDVAFEYYAVYRAESEPELAMAAIGALLVLIGLTAHMIWPAEAGYAVLTSEGPEAGEGWLILPHSARETQWVLCLRAMLAESQGAGEPDVA